MADDDDRQLDPETLGEGLKDRGRLDALREQAGFLRSQVQSQASKMRQTYGLNTVVWHDDTPDAVAEPIGERERLPVVQLQPPEVEYNGKHFQVEPDQALAFQAMIENYPERVGLTTIIGAHPERKMEKLPSELKAIVDTSGKGSRLKLS